MPLPVLTPSDQLYPSGTLWPRGAPLWQYADVIRRGAIGKPRHALYPGKGWWPGARVTETDPNPGGAQFRRFVYPSELAYPGDAFYPTDVQQAPLHYVAGVHFRGAGALSFSRVANAHSFVASFTGGGEFNVIVVETSGLVGTLPYRVYLADPTMRVSLAAAQSRGHLASFPSRVFLA